MKKYARITLTDGKEVDFYIAEKAFGEKLNTDPNIGYAITIARNGFCVDKSDEEPVVIAPSQIKSVKLIFKTL